MSTINTTFRIHRSDKLVITIPDVTVELGKESAFATGIAEENRGLDYIAWEHSIGFGYFMPCGDDPIPQFDQDQMDLPLSLQD